MAPTLMSIEESHEEVGGVGLRGPGLASAVPEIVKAPVARSVYFVVCLDVLMSQVHLNRARILPAFAR
jgi:hypothetical protein